MESYTRRISVSLNNPSVFDATNLSLVRAFTGIAVLTRMNIVNHNISDESG